MEEKIKLPENWGEMSHVERVIWFTDNFRNEDTFEYRLEDMSEDVKREYFTIIKPASGILLD